MPKKGHSKAVYLEPETHEKFKRFCAERKPKTTMFVLLNMIVEEFMDNEKSVEYFNEQERIKK